MRRFTAYIFYIAVFFSASVFSIFAAFIWNDEHWELARGSFVMCGGFNNDFAGGGGFISYVFYDGAKLAFFRAGFDSAEKAKSCYDSELQKATEIVERETLFDEAREKIVGERVVAIFSTNEYTKSEWARIINLNGDEILEVASSSLRHALNFERKRRR